MHFEVFPDDHSVNLSAQRPKRVYDILKAHYLALISRKHALLQHSNAPACTSNVTKSKLEETEGLKVLPHLDYCPDMTSYIPDPTTPDL